MPTETPRHHKVELDLTRGGYVWAAMVRRLNVMSRVIPGTADGRKALNLTLLVFVLPLLLLGVALVNFLTSNRSSTPVAPLVNSRQVDLALKTSLKHQALALTFIASDPTLVNAVLVNDSVDGAIKKGNEDQLASQRLDQLLQVNSGFESLALVNNQGEVAANAGILHQDFYLWQTTPSFYDSLNSQGSPSISPLKFGILTLDEDGDLDLSSSRIERLVFTAAGPSIGSKADGLIVGIMKSDALANPVQELLHQKPAGLGVPNSLATGLRDSPASDGDNSSIRLLSASGEEVAPVPLGPTVQDAMASNNPGSPLPYAGLSPFEETGTSWYSALPALTAQQGGKLFTNHVSVILATGSILLAMAAAWFIVRTPRSPQPAIAASENMAPNADASGPFTYSDARKASQRLVVVHESVRREMSDYLHGHVQSKLVAISMSLGLCQSMLTREPDQASLVLQQVQVNLQTVQDEDIRRVSHELYPTIVKMGLIPAMRSLTERFNHALKTDLIVDADVFALDQTGNVELPEKHRLGVYRIAEEALNNALKHSQATHIEVSLIRNESGSLVLSVADDGHGFVATGNSESQGLAMMNDYAKAIGGQAEITSSPEKGTTVVLDLFLEPPQMS